MKKSEKSAIIRALSENEPECEHNRFRETEFVEVSENYFVSELYCADCGYFFGFITEKRLKMLDLPKISLESLEELNAWINEVGCYLKANNREENQKEE